MMRAEAEFEDDLETDQSEAEIGDLDEQIGGEGGGGRKKRKVVQLDWNDRYRPRKPRYFNRVHTGYEWNRYNQMHYE